MKKLLLISAFVLSACGATHTENTDADGGTTPQKDCETQNAICEWNAIHQVSSQLLQWFYLRDCSWDYGACIGLLNEVDCKDWCVTITWIPSECIDACWQYGPPQTNTSTTPGT